MRRELSTIEKAVSKRLSQGFSKTLAPRLTALSAQYLKRADLNRPARSTGRAAPTLPPGGAFAAVQSDQTPGLLHLFTKLKCTKRLPGSALPSMHYPTRGLALAPVHPVRHHHAP